VRAGTALINTARGLTKSYGERLRGCSPRKLNPEKARGLSPELQAALERLLPASEALSERISEYNQPIANIAKESYPQVARLQQVRGVGKLIALTYLLTLEDPHGFRKRRDVGCYVGCNRDGGTQGRANCSCTSAKRATCICGRSWCRGRIIISWSVWSGQRSATPGTEAGRTWRKEWEETSRDCDGAKVSCFAAPVVGERRSLRAAAATSIAEMEECEDRARVKLRVALEEKSKKLAGLKGSGEFKFSEN
jgi:Transposase IS116/IS110/IS902 family